MRKTMIIIYNEINGVGNISFDGWNEADHPRDDTGRFTDNNGYSFLGREFIVYKGQAAIDKLMIEKQGYVKGAFYRRDIGDIDLVWGDDSKGLCHILCRRKETRQPLRKLLCSLTELIEKGELSRAKKGRLAIAYRGKVAIIEPQLYGDDIQFLFTAYYE